MPVKKLETRKVSCPKLVTSNCKKSWWGNLENWQPSVTLPIFIWDNLITDSFICLSDKWVTRQKNDDQSSLTGDRHLDIAPPCEVLVLGFTAEEPSMPYIDFRKLQWWIDAFSLFSFFEGYWNVEITIFKFHSVHEPLYCWKRPTGHVAEYDSLSSSKKLHKILGHAYWWIICLVDKQNLLSNLSSRQQLLSLLMTRLLFLASIAHWRPRSFPTLCQEKSISTTTFQ